MSKLKDLIRYFGLPLIVFAIMAITFIVFQGCIASEIQQGTYQILRESALQQSADVAKYLNMMVQKAEITTAYNQCTDKTTVTEMLKAELSGGDAKADIHVGYADLLGRVRFGDIDILDVSKKEWFLTGLNEQSDIAIYPSQSGDHDDVLIAVPAYADNAASGVLFAVIPNKSISDLIETTAYDGDAVSGVCDATGRFLFTERDSEFFSHQENAFNLIQDDSLENGVTQMSLKQAMLSGQEKRFHFSYYGEKYYTVIEPLGIQDWYLFSMVSATTADSIQRPVGAYISAMFAIIIIVGVAMTFQAYMHERATVRRLEQDKELLRQISARYVLINRLSNEVLFIVNMEDGGISFNDNFDAMFGSAPPVCSINDTDACFSLIDERDRPLFSQFVEQMQSGAAEAHEELRMVNTRGASRWKHLEVYTVFDSEGHAKEAVGKISDIHRQKQSLQRLRKQADSDSLTGLLNRSAMERYTREFLSGEGKEAKHAFFMLDFDNFKQVNDTLGHVEGDQMLVAFAYAVKRLFRSGDLVARIGGDEYTMLMKTIDSDDSALEKAEQIRRVMG